MKTDPKTRKRRNLQKQKRKPEKAVKTDQKVPEPSQNWKKNRTPRMLVGRPVKITMWGSPELP
jgi:hypothetical protein